MTARRLQVAFAMGEDTHARIFTADRVARIAEIADVRGMLSELDSDRSLRILADVEVLITGWGAPPFGLEMLERARRLEAILHAAGTVRGFLSDDVVRRGLPVSSAAEANAVPVAEYATAMIVLANKRVLPIAARYRDERAAFDVELAFPDLGNFRKRVGIVGASRIGRKVVQLLRGYELEVVVHDPHLTTAAARELGVALVELDELLATSDVVSVHAPSLPSTLGLIDARGIASMRHGATLVNTSRGELVDQDALTARVVAGELFAVLDVTTPWVLASDHPLYAHEGALLTPHIAGSMGVELGRLADSAIAELERLAEGRPLHHRVDADLLAITA